MFSSKNLMKRFFVFYSIFTFSTVAKNILSSDKIYVIYA